MRLCVATPCLFKGMDFCESVRRVARLGYDAVEIYDWRSLDADRVRATLAETGVRIYSLCTTEFRLTDPLFRSSFVDGVRESCAMARRLGAAKMITQVGQDTGETREEQHFSIVRGLSLAAPILEDAGVTLMIEPLNTAVNHKGYYLTSAREAFDIVREVDSPCVKVVYDIYHQQITEGNIIPTVTENLAHIAHLHAAGHPGRIEPWLGETDYKNVFAAIERAGYDGYCGLEYRPTLEAEESLRIARELYET